MKTFIECQLCGQLLGKITHTHLNSKHPSWSLTKYREAFPEAPLLNEKAIAELKEPRKTPKPRRLCLCSCGQLTSPGRCWVLGHNYRGADGYKKYLERQKRIQSNEMVECKCGCGQLRPRYNQFGGERQYITGHYWQSKKMPPESHKTRKRKRQARLGTRHPKHSMAMTGPGNPNWRGGISYEPYGAEFNNELKQQILERDSFACQACGAKAILPHHINYNKKDNSPRNLVAVCRSCNGKANYNRGAWMVYFFLLLWIGRAR